MYYVNTIVQCNDLHVTQQSHNTADPPAQRKLVPRLDDALAHLPRPGAVLARPRALVDGIIQPWWDARRHQLREPVDAHGLEIGHAAQALRTTEAAVPGALDAAKGQLHSVVDAKVVDRDHAGVDAGDAGGDVTTVVAEDAGAEGVLRGVGEGDGVGHRVGAHEHKDRGE